jgi:UDP-glucose 4-epimerase
VPRPGAQSPRTDAFSMTQASPRKVLVTGGAGFIGANVAAAYVRRGDHVVVLDDLSRGRAERVPPGAELVRMDVRSPAAAALVRERRFDLLSLHAAQVDVRVSVADPRHDMAVNLDGLLNLLEAVRAVGHGRVLFVSSGGVVYGDPPARPTPENAPKAPVSPYGVSKLSGEQYLMYYHLVHGVEYAALRYANVYGPGQDPHGEAGVVAIFCQRLLADEPVTVYGDGEQTRDYVYVGDVVDANLRAVDSDVTGAFNVGRGVATSVLDIVEALAAQSDNGFEADHLPARTGEVQHIALDPSRTKAELGWEAQVDLDQGLARTLDSLR